jgi:hypothetical protein
MEDVASRYFCEKCDYKCSNKTNFTKHLSTRKHKLMTHIMTPVTPVVIEPAPVPETKECYVCKCGKKYKYRQGLFVHKKSCSLELSLVKDSCVGIEDQKICDEINKKIVEDIKDSSDNLFLHDMIKQLIMENQELKNTMVKETHDLKTFVAEKIKTSGTTTNNNTINASVNNVHNKFNLNIFLNEDCKDAFNITDYIDKMELQLEDLEQTAKFGYTDGITKIISDRIRGTSITKRPFHCTDGKREIVYVKDNDVWEKEQSDKPRMRKMITNVIHKNLQQLIKWHEKYPDGDDTEQTINSKYLNIMIEANGGQEREKKEEQILKNVLKEALIPV